MTPLALLLAAALPSQVFTDHMMLQRDRPIPVWGTAAAGETVTVSFADQRATATADARGYWRATLAAEAASETPRELVVATAEAKTVVRDVIVGDVYLAAGQSNMQFPLCGPTARQHDRNGNTLVQIARDRGIRFTSPRRAWCATPTNDVALVWGAGVTEDLSRQLYEGHHEEGSTSAIAYHFARHLRAAAHVPVGFVDVSRGGAFLEPCLPPTEARQIKELQLHPYGAHQAPGVLWNSMIDPLKGFPFKGVLWYQGESNKCCTNGQYLVKFRALVKGWRREFGNPDLPFYYVQLAPNQAGHLSIQLQQAAYAKEDPLSSMVVVADLGNLKNIHPMDKDAVGLRLALRALKRDYGFADIEDASPEPIAAEVAVGGQVSVTFGHATDLYVLNDDMSLAADFELQDEKGVWHKARIRNFKETWVWYIKMNVCYGEIAGPTIRLTADGLANPVAVRYLFNSPWKSSVFNQASLPLGPFDSFPLVRAVK